MCTVIGEKYPVIEHKMWINVLIKYENKHKRTKTWEIGLTCIDRKSRYTPGVLAPNTYLTIVCNQVP